MRLLPLVARGLLRTARSISPLADFRAMAPVTRQAGLEFLQPLGVDKGFENSPYFIAVFASPQASQETHIRELGDIPGDAIRQPGRVRAVREEGANQIDNLLPA